MTDTLVDKAAKTVERHGMLKEGMRVLVAVSGGPDSVALLHALMGLRPAYGLKLGVCHLNHNLRGAESAGDERFVERLAKRLGLGFHSRTLEKGALDCLGEGLQDAARRMRYGFFEEAARRFKADRVALGHTLDDRAETVLMRLIKGASLSGLAGIPPARGLYVRPLFEVGRAEIEAFLKSVGAAYRVDSSNLANDYLRNDVRSRLIPLLVREYNPGIVETLARVSDALRADDAFIGAEAERAYRAALLSERASSVGLDAGRLRGLSPALLARVFLLAARRLEPGARLASIHSEAFLSAVGTRRPNAAYCLPAGLMLSREYENIFVAKRGAPSAARPYAARLAVPGKVFIAEAGRVVSASVLKRAPRSLKAGPVAAYFDYDEVSRAGAVEVRSPRPGDRFRPFGMKGRRKLKDLFIDRKVVPAERRRVPVLVSGGDIIWVAGVARSDLFKVTGSTGRVLKLTVSAAD